MKLETVMPTTLDQVVPLITEYQKFYRVKTEPERTREFFRELTLPGNGKGILFRAVGETGETLGFTTLYFVPSSLSARTVCVLNDLYTVPESRGHGVARALMAHAVEFARAKGYHALDWQTELGNKTAQRLYDKLPAQKSEWYYYTLPIE